MTESLEVKLTQLGTKHGGGICALLQIGPFNILLDCGCVPSDFTKISTLEEKLKEIGGVHIVLLSHADVQHIGALPILFGCDKPSDALIVCTYPVFKMAQMVLYDMELNMNMEEKSPDSRRFSLDDIDQCFSNVMTVKYNQVCGMHGHSDDSSKDIYVCAYPAGRTIGGAMWSIRYGSTEILYAMDINLKKEILIDGASMNLPTSPALLIVEGTGIRDNLTSRIAVSRRRKDRADDGLISSVLDVVRRDGNCLLPTETAGRTLELLLQLNKCWTDNKLGMYHLVYLSPMAVNTIDFVRCQLEWMSDSLCHEFYSGGINPFALTNVKCVTSLKEFDHIGTGPKVVLVTDASLSCGLSKALLLRWGGDPKSRVIFSDLSEVDSLASELRGQDPPVIATVVRSERVNLSGEELEAYERQEALKRKNIDTANQRRKRERELTAVREKLSSMRFTDCFLF